MLTYISNLINYLLNINDDKEDDNVKEEFLAQELVELEIQNEKEECFQITPIEESSLTPKCITRTGVITFCGDNFILIDGMIYYNTSNCLLNLNLNDKITFLGYKDTNDSFIIVRVLENHGLFWGDENELEEKTFDVIIHVLIGQVNKRQDRYVYINESDLKFSLDDVEGTFMPIEGDWLEMKCLVQQNDVNLSDITANKVVKVISFKPIRTKVTTGSVTQWFGNSGICDGKIYFDVTSLLCGAKPNVGCKVLVEAIESNQDSCTWRALKVNIVNQASSEDKEFGLQDAEQISLNLEKEKCINMTHPLKFDTLKLNEAGKRIIKLSIVNNSNMLYVLNKWIMLSRKRDSQIEIKPFINQSIKLLPGNNFDLTVSCTPKFLGQSRECLVILFKGFQLKRFIEIVVENEEHITKNVFVGNGIKTHHKIKAMKNIIHSTETAIPGVPIKKNPAFINVRIGNYNIPDKIWSILLTDADKMMDKNDFYKVASCLEKNFPFLSQNSNISNYIDKWHTILYLEEAEANIRMRSYDSDRVFLMHCSEYLGIEVNGLAERKPSIVTGDKAIVKDIWDENSPRYEGIIHAIKGNLVLMKFRPQFHENYKGGDVSIEFHISRSVFKRSHHAINIALSSLGPNILFPSRLISKLTQLAIENIDEIKWLNTSLNTEQKSAVLNIIRGECRPMPYIIFGPPGTGKTVTVVETILQILMLIPESRILIATPSNSAANLITERLIQYKDSINGSIVRLIATYLIDSDTIPDQIKPFCATVDISTEYSSECKYEIKNNISLNCQKSLIGRHRVTIGTCCSLGSLVHLGLPKGHFTHVIIDEAGQASEPEIMIPLTFIDKNNGQIVLAGDPMQLGPVVQSNFSKEYGMDISFLCRILDTFPYLKDYHAFTNGFDHRLVIKLNDNYRSLEGIISLSNELFYDGTLVAKINDAELWTSKFITATSEIFDSKSINGGTFMYGIKGYNLRAEDSPSWYNPQEASMVALTLCKLYKKNITQDEIGIITPYIAQVKYIRTLCDSMGLPQPKIGTVEDFQGQERPIVLISTVRSNISYVEDDIRHSLGFVSSAKRLNVALTRAQISTFIFCNPHLLYKDHFWNKVIKDVISKEKYMGCDLPHEFNENNTID